MGKFIGSPSRGVLCVRLWKSTLWLTMTYALVWLGRMGMSISIVPTVFCAMVFRKMGLLHWPLDD
uniref:DUF418 domain-containing protein n=1 Tax=Breznakibacter xylanolyticus TaxID=990 RepID=UPI003743CEC0